MQHPTVYASLVYESCVRLDFTSPLVANSVEIASASVALHGSNEAHYDRILRQITRLSSYQTTFTAFVNLFLLWLESASQCPLDEVGRFLATLIKERKGRWVRAGVGYCISYQPTRAHTVPQRVNWPICYLNPMTITASAGAMPTSPKSPHIRPTTSTSPNPSPTTSSHPYTHPHPLDKLLPPPPSASTIELSSGGRFVAVGG
ncbi:hypothetical protein H0H93_007014 [Arthromyces matolae]|nr:hypothetical protein H0H93_007014 [Arthromyces matolae]